MFHNSTIFTVFLNQQNQFYLFFNRLKLCMNGIHMHMCIYIHIRLHCIDLSVLLIFIIEYELFKFNITTKYYKISNVIKYN